MRKHIALMIALALVVTTGQVFAIGQARLTGKVVDANGKGIPDVDIEIVAAEKISYKDKAKTKKDGSFAIAVVDGTLKYTFTYSKEGVGKYSETLKLKLAPEKNETTITLAGPQVVNQAAVEAQTATDKATVTYNEGVALVKEGKIDEAIAKFEAAVKERPDLTAAYAALAKMHAKKKNWDKAIENADKVLALDADDPGMNAVMAQAWEGKGDKAKAAEFREKAPANPSQLFNEAARHINAGRDAEAEPLLRKAIGADESFAKAYYELGMVYVRMDRKADAKMNFEKYIELDPKGADVATAREMLKYLN